VIGILGIEYVKRKKELTKEDIQILEIEAAQIGGVLHNHLIQK
jgi:GAF domain-containing protein